MYINDPYSLEKGAIVNIFDNIIASIPKGLKNEELPLKIKTDATLNPRWSSIILKNVKVAPSPAWLQKFLTLTEIRPINNVVDTTNYLMRSYGQPVHAFDYAKIGKNRSGMPSMTLRAAKKGEKLITLDGKTHTLPGGDIVIEDGSGNLIDLCGIMGGENSAITENTTEVLLFTQTYSPQQIRKTSMALAHRSEASSLFEKGIDTQLSLPTLYSGMALLKAYASAEYASKIHDIYLQPFKSYLVSVSREKLLSYMGVLLSDSEIKTILTSLGFAVTFTKTTISVKVPSFRRDVQIDVDIIEEVARIYGYHNIEPRLPSGELPQIQPDPILKLESQIKTRLRDWGYSETYTYSMISEELMNLFNLSKEESYKIANPLSSEWVHMRPSLIPSMLACISQNLRIRDNLKLFELSNRYILNSGDLPHEQPMLVVIQSGEQFLELKGLAETIFSLFGISAEHAVGEYAYLQPNKTLIYKELGAVGTVEPKYLKELGIKVPVTLLELNVTRMQELRSSEKAYQPIPKYPPVIEDMTFSFAQRVTFAEIKNTIISSFPLVKRVTLLNQYKDRQTFQFEYRSDEHTLIQEEVALTRKAIATTMKELFKSEVIAGEQADS